MWVCVDIHNISYMYTCLQLRCHVWSLRYSGIVAVMCGFNYISICSFRPKVDFALYGSLHRSCALTSFSHEVSHPHQYSQIDSVTRVRG